MTKIAFDNPRHETFPWNIIKTIKKGFLIVFFILLKSKKTSIICLLRGVPKSLTVAEFNANG